MFGLTPKSVLKYALIFLAFPVVINFTVFLGRLPLVFGNADNWLSFWGNYTGGIISAIVATYVAVNQINKQAQKDIEKDNRDRILNQLPALVRLKIELEKIISTLKFAVDSKHKLEELKVDKIFGDLTRYPAEPIEEENWANLDRLVDIELQANLIMCKSFYKEFSNALTYPYPSVMVRIEEIEISLATDSHNAQDHADWITLREEYSKMENAQKNGFVKLEDENYIEELERLLKIINKDIEKVKQIQFVLQKF
ncbi:hypothetical protein SAMN04488137_1009 [Fictibacillus solisalsi]|uniref:Uncharacterized protein n=1 Tax=Fictibacillus solisalsi TaxID=459525 RepID=A0A1G9UM61_9BACL|nr:hypothetical protein [Fictibacillus solisalsi]SDM60971.1 hypothetical protein SAMN04488137_1009 [Fictibacillus solisalsi]